MLNGIKCEPCNGTGLTVVFDAQAVMRAMAHVQQGNTVGAVKALREYTSAETSLKDAVDYVKGVITPEVEAIQTEEYQVRSRRATRQTDAYGGGWGDEGKCSDCIVPDCKECADGIKTCLD